MANLTTQQALDLAARHKKSGRVHEAGQLLRQIVDQHPENAEAVHQLGLIAQQLGHNDIAANLFKRVIALDPENVNALCNLGNALKSSGRLDEATVAYRRAVALKPAFAEAYSNLGVALKDKGEPGAAIAALREAIALRPDFPEAYINLGNILRNEGEVDEAIAAYRQAILLKPNSVTAYSNLGNALRDKGEIDQALAAYRQATVIRPDYAEAQYNLSIVLNEKGLVGEAIAASRRAIALKPKFPEAYGNLGNSLRDVGQIDEATAAYRKAIGFNPSYADAYNNLGIALSDKGQLDESIAASRQAIALKPNFATAHNNLGNALKDSGRLDEAIASFRQSIFIDSSYHEAHSNLIYTLHCHPAYDASRIAEELRLWNRQHALKQAPAGAPSHANPGRSNDTDANRPLRIGYVSPDFRDHVVGRNVLPLFRQHNRRAFEIFCYSESRAEDSITEEFRSHADGWRKIAALSDEKTANLIREDRIDILVDLALHTAGNRLLVFARKPAPVQATFAGYPGSTGLSAIDYRLSDPYLDPPDMGQSAYSEQTVRLPDAFWCYDPLDCREIPLNALPALESGVITFGCLNNFCKINDQMLTVWAQVLRQVERSRLLLLSKQGSHRQRTMDQLKQNGIDPARIEFLSLRPRKQYMELYHRIDIGLDSFPYNGHTTSLDSFWMGVPVVTLVGNSPVSRAGWCHLSNLGLRELAGHDAAEFVRIAVELAADLPRLEEMRSKLRGRMLRSPLTDAPKFAKSIEAAYRHIWQKWCESPSKVS